jgi:hypothetical protein
MRSTFGRVSSLAVVAATAIFVACDESPTSPDSQDQTLAAPALDAHAGNPTVLTATGGVRVPTPLIGSGASAGYWRTISFTAIQRADGTATGNIQYSQRADYPSNVRQHGTVTCVNDLGSGVILIAAHGTNRVADVDAPPLFGLPPADFSNDHGMVFAVRDNGEGASEPADEISAALHTTEGAADAICASPAGFGFNVALAESFFNNVASGNIQVTR